MFPVGLLMRTRALREEDGLALVLAMAVLVLLSTITVTAITMALSSNGTAQNSNAQQGALELAQAGVNRAEAILNATGANAVSPTLLGCTANGNASTTPCTPITGTANGGTYSFSGMYANGTNSGVWTITSTGSVANPNGGGVSNIQRTATATVNVTGGGQGTNISVWNYMYSTAPSDGNPNTCEVTFNADHDTITVPLYVTGDLCLNADHSTIMQNTSGGGQQVDVRVGGGITLAGTHATIGCDPGGSLGTCNGNTSPIYSGYSALGCRTSAGGTYHPCTTADHWYVSHTDSPITASPPTLNFTSWYANASPGPSHTCDSTLTPSPNLMTTQPHAFDNDTTMNGTNTIFNITPTNADYNRVTSTGTLDWNHTTHLLTISGTIFFDGNLEFTDGAASYSGLATIYANGEIFFSNGGTASGITANCPVSNVPHQCGINNGTWNPNTNMMILVASKASGTAVDMSVDHSEYQGDLACPPTSSVTIAGDHTIVEGGIICGNFSFGDHSQIYPLPTITNLPPGAPTPPNANATISAPTYNS